MFTVTMKRGLVRSPTLITSSLMKPSLKRRSYASVKTLNIDWNPIKTKRQLIKGREIGPQTSRHFVFLLMCLTPIVTFGLGCWQVKRLKWKNKLIAGCEDRLTYEATPLPKNVTAQQLPDLEYRKVYITGHFDYSREIFVGPRLHDNMKGYLLICPFIQSNGGGEILVDRGWIKDDKVIPERRNLQHLSVPEGDITIECFLKDPPKKGMFHWDHEEGLRLFTYVDINAMAKELNSRPIYAQVLENFHDRPEWLKEADQSENLESTVPWYKFWSRSDSKETTNTQAKVNKPSLDYDDSVEFSPLQFINAGVPLGKQPKIEYTNNHMNYLVTWFGLSFASSVLLALTLKKGKMVNPLQEKLKHANKTFR